MIAIVRLILFLAVSASLAACANAISFPNAKIDTNDQKVETLSGLLFKPEGQGPFPAVVLLHSCGGFTSHVTSDWPSYLRGLGYVVLSVDTFGSRGVARCPNPYSGTTTFVKDAYGALDFLAAQPFVDKNRIAVMGFSLGANHINSAIAPVRERATGGPNFKAAVAFYGLCSRIPSYDPGSVPLMQIAAEKDTFHAPGCEQTKSMFPEIEVHILPGAYHAFDSPEASGKRGAVGERQEYSRSATERARELTRVFLAKRLGG
jgi:dienelactone hydrolase